MKTSVNSEISVGKKIGIILKKGKAPADNSLNEKRRIISVLKKFRNIYFVSSSIWRLLASDIMASKSCSISPFIMLGKSYIEIPNL